MKNSNEAIYRIAFSMLPNIGPIMAKRILSYTGSIEAVFHEPKKNLLKIPNLGKYTVSKIQSADLFKKAEKEIHFCEKYNIDILFYTDKNYPQRLKNCEDAPILLYSKGEVDYNRVKVLSIVGTRHSTERGIENCEKLVKELGNNDKNIIIVSGLAYGIDICAHKSSLKNGNPTVGVLAHGLNTIYPSLHRDIAERMVRNGSLLTEFSSNTKAVSFNFVSRNRIIAGLADATVVVESAHKGGALITADIANSYNRDVFAFPGRITDTQSQGCNHLIKTNKAALIEKARDLEYVLGWEINKTKHKIIQRQLFNELSGKEKKVVEILNDKDSVQIDEISINTGMPASQVSPVLLELEFKGLVKSLPGKRYKILTN
ncbi:MAG: DNA-processing protein DprA [Bacteroidales bacterium]